MIEEEYPISIEDLKNKFKNWFGKPIPADPSFSADVERSRGKPVPVNLPLPPVTERLDHNAQRKQADSSQKLSELLSFGFMGAVTSGAVVGFIILLLSLGLPGWYRDTGISPFVIILFALLLGFYIGLSKGYISQQREEYFRKGEF
jgi:hypothetical protein